MKPEFATNRPGERVADALAGHLEYLRATWSKPVEVAIATAYFNPDGFSLIADELEKVSGVPLVARGSTAATRATNPTANQRFATEG